MKLTIIVPAFNAEKWFELNKEFWLSVTKLVKVIVIEDNDPGVSKATVESFGGEYHSKKNGNWGSVINYAMDKKLIKTPYFAIVDSDDKINLDDFKVLIEKLNGKDLYITNVIKKSFINGSEKILDKSKFSKNRTVPFIHSIWIKTDLVKDLPRMPENTFYSDDLLVTFIQSQKNLVWEYISCAPYIHFIDMPGQSISQYKNPKTDFAKNFYQYLRFGEFIGKTSNKKILKNSHETAIYDLCLLFSLTNLKAMRASALKAIDKHIPFLPVPKFLIIIYFISTRIWFTKTRKKLGNY